MPRAARARAHSPRRAPAIRRSRRTISRSARSAAAGSSSTESSSLRSRTAPAMLCDRGLAGDDLALGGLELVARRGRPRRRPRHARSRARGRRHSSSAMGCATWSWSCCAVGSCTAARAAPPRPWRPCTIAARASPSAMSRRVSAAASRDRAASSARRAASRRSSTWAPSAFALDTSSSASSAREPGGFRGGPDLAGPGACGGAAAASSSAWRSTRSREPAIQRVVRFERPRSRRRGG